jgi:hypothetical protein
MSAQTFLEKAPCPDREEKHLTAVKKEIQKIGTNYESGLIYIATNQKDSLTSSFPI